MSIYQDIMTGLNEAVEYKSGNARARKSKWEIKGVPDFSARDIRQIRMESKYTQSTFSSLLGVSVKAVEAWECGRNTPDGPTRRLISLMKVDGTIFEKYDILTHEALPEPYFTNKPVIISTTTSQSLIKPIVLQRDMQSERTIQLNGVENCLAY